MIAAIVATTGSTVAALTTVSPGATIDTAATRTREVVEFEIDRFVPPVRTVLIADSAIAGLRYSEVLDRLVGSTWFTDLEVCRRLVATSCTATGSPRPPTLVQELALLPFQPNELDLLVVATGYNDGWDHFAADVAAVVGAARAAGFRHIAWMDYRVAGTGWPFSNYARMNAILADLVASGAYPDLTIWGYDAFTFGQTSWFNADRIHLTPSGAAAIADWLSSMVAAHDVL